MAERAATYVRRVAALLAIVYFAFHLHGFSIGSWAPALGSQLDLSRFHWFESQPVRSDDWVVNFPLWVSQVRHGYPAANPDLAFSQRLIVTASPVPTLDWTVAFKPQVWGFFLGIDHGMSWFWTFCAFGLFLVFFELLKRMDVSGRIATLPRVFLALTFSFSSFFQYWSHVPSSMTVFAGIWVLLLLELTGESRDRPRQVLVQLGLAYVSVAFSLCIYPPFQIPLALVMLTVAALRVLERPSRVWKLIPPAALAAAILVAFAWDNYETIQALANTVYPGQRRSNGGRGSFLYLFQNQLVNLRHADSLSNLGSNISEAGGFINFVPLLAILVFSARERLTKVWRRGFILLALTFAIYLIWFRFGLPPTLAALSLLNRTTEMRTVFFWGIAGFILIPAAFDRKPGRWESPVLALWLAAHAAAWVICLRDGTLDRQTLYRSLVLISLFGLASYALVRRQAAWFGALFLSATLLQTLTFNPLVFGRVDDLLNSSPLVRLIQTHRPAEGDAMLVFGSHAVSNLPRLLGVRAYSGVFPLPDRRLWSILDPENRFDSVWNRYAHTAFHLRPAGSKDTPVLLQSDLILVSLATDSPALKALRPRQLLIQASELQYSGSDYRQVGEAAGWTLYELTTP